MMKPMALCAALALFAGINAPKLSAEPVCINADLLGIYAMHAPGTILAAPGFPASLLGPFVRVGEAIADGRGNITVANTASYNGTIIPETYAGTYTVSTDCSVDVQVLVGIPLGPGGSLVNVPFEFQGSLSDNGNSAAFVLCGVGAPCFAQPTGNVIRVLFTRNTIYSGLSNCTAASLSGAFQLDMSGVVVAGTTPGLFARDGLVAFDGRGAFTVKTTVNSAGTSLATESLTGTYTVDSLCNASLSYTTSDKVKHLWIGTVTNNGNGAYIMVSEAGSVISGTLTKQRPGFQWVF